MYFLICEEFGRATKGRVNVEVEIYLLKNFSFFRLFLLDMSILDKRVLLEIGKVIRLELCKCRPDYYK